MRRCHKSNSLVPLTLLVPHTSLCGHIRVPIQYLSDHWNEIDCNVCRKIGLSEGYGVQNYVAEPCMTTGCSQRVTKTEYSSDHRNKLCNQCNLVYQDGYSAGWENGYEDGYDEAMTK